MSAVKKGDTLIEVVLSFVMFGLVAAISVSVMLSSISGAEAAIELTLARVEIDSQSEVIRFVHEAYTIDHAYNNLWDKILEQVISPSDSTKLPSLDVDSCNDLYKENLSGSTMTIDKAKAFILNPRRINNGASQDKPDFYGETLVTSASAGNKDKFSAATLNPRIIYTKSSSLEGGDQAVIGVVDDDAQTNEDTINNEGAYDIIFRAEGIYDFLVKSTSAPNPAHYDFYVYTCWYAPGAERPTTIGTVTRLYNPEYVDAK